MATLHCQSKNNPLAYIETWDRIVNEDTLTTGCVLTCIYEADQSDFQNCKASFLMSLTSQTSTLSTGRVIFDYAQRACSAKIVYILYQNKQFFAQHFVVLTVQ